MNNDWIEDIRAIFFDLDETLIDAPRGLKHAHRAVAEEIYENFRCEEQDIDELTVAESLAEFDDRMNRNRDYDRDEWWGSFVEELSIEEEVREDLAEELTRIYWEEYAEAAKPYPFTSPVLNYLNDKGYKLGLITDTDASGTEDEKGRAVEFFRFI